MTRSECKRSADWNPQLAHSRNSPRLLRSRSHHAGPQRTVEELRKSDIDPYDNIKRPKNSGILTASATMERFIDNMICQGIRTRNIHLRMPDPQFVADRKLMDLRMLFEEARNILVPNGPSLMELIY